MTKKITVNGRVHSVRAADDGLLLYALRDELKLGGPKYGCGFAQCGACTVHHGSEAVRSCITPLSVVEKPITTIEGLGTVEKPHPLQTAFVEEQAVQCGYCISGMVMSAAALLAKNPKPTRDEIVEALEGNLCRCGTHMRILRAVQRAAGVAS